MQAMINELGLLVQGGFVLMADYVECQEGNPRVPGSTSKKRIHTQSTFIVLKESFGKET